MKRLLILSATLLLGQAHGRVDIFEKTTTARNMSKWQMVNQQAKYNLEGEHNGDDTGVAQLAGSFTKTFEHDATTGNVTADGLASYAQLLKAVGTGKQADYNAITRAPGATRKLVSPQAAHAVSLLGVPCICLPMPPAPNLTSAHAAVEMVEVYLKAICRDVDFKDYGTGAGTDVDGVNGGSMTNNAAAVLTALNNAHPGAYKGPVSGGGTVTATELFRGVAQGCLDGPYISQFWYQPLHHLNQNYAGNKSLATQQVLIAQAREFGVSWNDYIAIQNGQVPVPYDASDFNGQRFIITGKDGATAVHSDGPGEFFYNAFNVLANHGFPFAPNLPYNDGSMTNEAGFAVMAPGDVIAATTLAVQEALKHAWAHKWIGNRRLRPEAMAGLVHRAKTDTNEFNLHSLLFDPLQTANIDVLAWILARNQAQAPTYLLPLVFPEGSPTHPAYPAGHAVVAGACVTILKAFFDDQTPFSTYLAPVKPDPSDPTQLVALTGPEGANTITVGGELNKLAANVALSRNFSGVHYRADGDDGMNLGENVALKILQEYARTYNEQGFTGFELSLFNGQRVRVDKNGVTNI